MRISSVAGVMLVAAAIGISACSTTSTVPGPTVTKRVSVPGPTVTVTETVSAPPPPLTSSGGTPAPSQAPEPPAAAAPACAAQLRADGYTVEGQQRVNLGPWRAFAYGRNSSGAGEFVARATSSSAAFAASGYIDAVGVVHLSGDLGIADEIYYSKMLQWMDNNGF